jgi:hypothetical protein
LPCRNEKCGSKQTQEYSIARMRKVSFLFLCCLVLFACNDIRVSIGGKGVFTLSLFELSAYLLLLTMCMFVLPIGSSHQFKKQHDLIFDSPTKWLTFYLLWTLFAAAFYSGDKTHTIQMDFKYLVPSAIAYIGLLLLADDRRTTHLIHITWFTAGLINAAVALSQYFFEFPYFIRYSDEAAGKLDLLTGEVARPLVIGLGSSSNMLAQIVMPWFIVATVVWLTKKNLVTINSLLWLLLSILFGFVLFTTHSKGALLWSTAGIGVGVAMTKWNKLRSSLWLVLLVVAIVAAINGLAAHGSEPSPGKTFETMQSRIDFIIACWHLLIAHPLNAIIGGGLKYWDQYAYRWATWQFYDAHNVYLNQILMYGLIGVFLFSGFILSCIRRGLRKLDYVEEGLLSPFPYIGAVFGMIGEYWFEPSFKDPIQKYQLLFVLAMLLVVRKLTYSQAEEMS